MPIALQLRLAAVAALLAAAAPAVGSEGGRNRRTSAYHYGAHGRRIPADRRDESRPRSRLRRVRRRAVRRVASPVSDHGAFGDYAQMGVVQGDGWRGRAGGWGSAAAQARSASARLGFTYGAHGRRVPRSSLYQVPRRPHAVPADDDPWASATREGEAADGRRQWAPTMPNSAPGLNVVRAEAAVRETREHWQEHQQEMRTAEAQQRQLRQLQQTVDAGRAAEASMVQTQEQAQEVEYALQEQLQFDQQDLDALRERRRQREALEAPTRPNSAPGLRVRSPPPPAEAAREQRIHALQQQQQATMQQRAQKLQQLRRLVESGHAAAAQMAQLQAGGGGAEGGGQGASGEDRGDEAVSASELPGAESDGAGNSMRFVSRQGTSARPRSNTKELRTRELEAARMIDKNNLSPENLTRTELGLGDPGVQRRTTQQAAGALKRRNKDMQATLKRATQKRSAELQQLRQLLSPAAKLDVMEQQALREQSGEKGLVDPNDIPLTPPEGQMLHVSKANIESYVSSDPQRVQELAERIKTAKALEAARLLAVQDQASVEIANQKTRLTKAALQVGLKGYLDRAKRLGDHFESMDPKKLNPELKKLMKGYVDLKGAEQPHTESVSKMAIYDILHGVEKLRLMIPKLGRVVADVSSTTAGVRADSDVSKGAVDAYEAMKQIANTGMAQAAAAKLKLELTAVETKKQEQNTTTALAEAELEETEKADTETVQLEKKLQNITAAAREAQQKTTLAAAASVGAAAKGEASNKAKKTQAAAKTRKVRVAVKAVEGVREAEKLTTRYKMYFNETRKKYNRTKTVLAVASQLSDNIITALRGGASEIEIMDRLEASLHACDEARGSPLLLWGRGVYGTGRTSRCTRRCGRARGRGLVCACVTGGREARPSSEMVGPCGSRSLQAQLMQKQVIVQERRLERMRVIALKAQLRASMKPSVPETPFDPNMKWQLFGAEKAEQDKLTRLQSEANAAAARAESAVRSAEGHALYSNYNITADHSKSVLFGDNENDPAFKPGASGGNTTNGNTADGNTADDSENGDYITEDMDAMTLKRWDDLMDPNWRAASGLPPLAELHEEKESGPPVDPRSGASPSDGPDKALLPRVGESGIGPAISEMPLDDKPPPGFPTMDIYNEVGRPS